jgi:XPG N-terminal domain
MYSSALTLIDRYVDYAMHRVRLLQYHKIVPYIVFDGGPLPAKKGTEVERKRYESILYCIVLFESMRTVMKFTANVMRVSPWPILWLGRASIVMHVNTT